MVSTPAAVMMPWLSAVPSIPFAVITTFSTSVVLATKVAPVIVATRLTLLASAASIVAVASFNAMVAPEVNVLNVVVEPATAPFMVT